MKLRFIYLLLCSALIACKKEKLPPNIIDSNIDISHDTISVTQIKVANIFEPSPGFLAYFSAAALPFNDKIAFVGTEAPYDHDFAPANLQIRKTDLDLNIISDKSLFKSNLAKYNSVTPSFINVKEKLQFYYLRQESWQESQIYLTESYDNGLTWPVDRKISFLEGVNGIINDRVIILSSGRIMIPVSYTNDIHNNYDGQIIFCYFSDDNGQTWSKSSELRTSTPLMEPSVAEYAPGKLLMVIRSGLGKLLFSRSTDNGISWSTIEKSKISAPASTSALFRMEEGILGMIWNHSESAIHVQDRKRLSLSVSKDGGNSWSVPYLIGNEEGEIYTSPGMFKHNGYWYVYFNYSAYVGEYGIRAKKLRISY